MTRLSHVAWMVALSGIGFTACGARTGLLVGSELVGESADGGSVIVPVEASSCSAGGAIPVELNAPNLYFVLDHSKSMNEQNKWTNVRTVVSNLMTQIGPGARFGAAMFPATSNQCAPGTEVMSVRQGDFQGTVANTFLSVTTAAPDGGTPTAATLRALLPMLTALRGQTFVILATDGGPNCDTALSCQQGDCTLNIDSATNCPANMNCCLPPFSTDGTGCLDGNNAATAAGDLDTAGVQTFVMGIPGSAPYSTVLDSIAVAGGTARTSEPLYYRVDTSDTGALSGALAQIAAMTGAGCTFTLQKPAANPAGAQVSVGGSVVSPGGQDGWSLAGTTLTLGGSSCNAVRTAGGAAVQFIDGCER